MSTAFSTWTVAEALVQPLMSLGVDIDKLTRTVREAKDNGIIKSTAREGAMRLGKSSAQGTMSLTHKVKLPDGPLTRFVAWSDLLAGAEKIAPVEITVAGWIADWSRKAFPHTKA